MEKSISTSFAIIVVALVAAIFGFIFWFGDKSESEIAKIQENSQAQLAKKNNNQSYIEVEELGFKIPVNAKRAQEITYKIGMKDKRNDFSNQACFSTKLLDVAYENCNEWTGVYCIEKIYGKPTDDNNMIYDSNNNSQKIVRPGIIKQLDNFYLYVAGGTQVSCSDMKEINIEKGVIKSINAGLQNVILID